MRFPRPAAIVATMALLSACGSGQAATRGYSVTDFDHVRVDGPFDVRIHTGGSTSARATGTAEALDRLSVEVQGGTLIIRPLPGGWGGWPGSGTSRVVVDVATRGLSGIGLSGSGDVTVDRVKGDRLDLMMAGSGDLSIGDVTVTRIGATLTGSGDMRLAGRAAEARALLRGSGDIHADAFMTEAADVTAIGSGSVTIGASKTAKVSLTGSGDVSIIGPATCAITSTGSGDVHCAHGSGGGSN